VVGTEGVEPPTGLHPTVVLGLQGVFAVGRKFSAHNWRR